MYRDCQPVDDDWIGRAGDRPTDAQGASLASAADRSGQVCSYARPTAKLGCTTGRASGPPSALGAAHRFRGDLIDRMDVEELAPGG